MKKLLLLSLVAILLMFTYSCSNEFELNAPWKDVPVIYGILSKLDTAHYSRVEKAFLDSSTSALEIAQRPDPLYYENPAVLLERFDEDNVVQTLNLVRVDGNLEGYQREDGICLLYTSPSPRD